MQAGCYNRARIQTLRAAATMVLTLEVVGPEGDELGLARRKVFDTTGGTIGRLKGNTWTLTEGHVSGRHAVIRFRDGQFLIEDTSTNGTSLNSPNNKLEKGRQYPLASNDLILIEPFEIRVKIEESGRGAQPSAPAAAPARPREERPILEPVSEVVDPMAALGFGPSPKPAAAMPRPRPVDLGPKPPQADVFVPPRVVAPPVVESEPTLEDTPENPIPDWDFINDRPLGSPAAKEPAPARARRSEPEPAPPPARPHPRPTPSPRTRAAAPAPPPPAAPETTAAALADVLRGAGIDPALVTPELARDLGRILRIVVSGVLDVLEVRKRIKEEFRLGVTTIRPQDNNPLKMSADVDDALHNLLVKRSAAYLPPADAFEDAFADIRGHQMAMLEGMRAAFYALMERFDPDRLQQEFDQQGRKGALFSVSAKSAYWDLYCEKIRGMVRDSEASFRELFGDEFAGAYEEHLRRHKARSRGGDQ